MYTWSKNKSTYESSLSAFKNTQHMKMKEFMTKALKKLNFINHHSISWLSEDEREKEAVKRVWSCYKLLLCM